MARLLQVGADTTFSLFLLLALLTPAWRVGPFTWWPLWQHPLLAGRPATLGALSLLPLLTALLWLGARWADSAPRRWQWGRPALTLPVAGLTLLGVISLEPAPSWRTVTQLVGLLLLWFTYLLSLNTRPHLTGIFALVLLGQGGVATAQFWLQRDLGLVGLGEPTLLVHQAGTSVLLARGEPWLRGYGLTAHPNILGATLALLLLLLLPALERARGWRRLALATAASVGVGGLLVSFSRGAWLAFGVGLLVWGWQRRQHSAGSAATGSTPLRFAPLLLVPLFLVVYRDLVLSRFLIHSIPSEALSLHERLRDGRCALEVSAVHWGHGSGLGNYLAAARALCPGAATVHNAPLLVAAELGLPGAALWLSLAVAGLRPGTLALAAWVAFLVAGLFDNTLWPTTSWRAALLFALLTAENAR